MLLNNALLLAAVLVAALLPAAVYAQGQGQGPGQGPGRGQGLQQERSLEPPGRAQRPAGPPARQAGPAPAAGGGALTLNFSSGERRLVRDWFRHNPVQPAALPPGIARNLQRGKPLPPGIAKRYLPQPLLGQLPYYEGYDYLLIGASVVLVAAATGIVVDIIVDAF